MNAVPKKPITSLTVQNHSIAVDLASINACGGVVDAFEATYKVTTRGLPDSIYVIEVNTLMDKVEGAFRTGNPVEAQGENAMIVASCEQLAGGIVFVAHSLLGDALESIDVVVENTTGDVNLLWVKGEEVPAFPRKAKSAERSATLRDRAAGVPRNLRC